MLAVVVAAGLSPNVGVVQAQTNGQYNQSPSSGLALWEYAAIAAVAIAALLALALLLMRRRRRPPPAAPAPPMQAWEGGPAGGAAAPPPPPAAAPSPPPAPPAYLETPEDVGHAPPAVPVSKEAAVAGAAAGAAGTGAAAGAAGEPDIDSLMAELDKISGEILKRAPKKGTPPANETAGDETTR
jgi:hypothetical protein